MDLHITGEEVENRLRLILSAPNKPQYNVPVHMNDWTEIDSEDCNYYLDVTLWGTFCDGFCPIVYFLSSNDNQKYTMRYKYQSIISEDASELQIYSNKKMNGTLIIRNATNTFKYEPEESVKIEKKKRGKKKKDA